MNKNKLATSFSFLMAVCGTSALLFGMAATTGIAADKMIKVGDKEYP